jgi:hypothetical protein
MFDTEEKLNELLPETPEAPKEEVEVPTEAPEVPKEVVETPASRNFRALSEAKRKVEKERDEALARIRAFESKIVTEPAEEVNSVEDFEDTDDKYKKLAREQQNMKLQMMAQNAEQQLRKQYPDFDDVVSPDNIAILNEAEPEIAQSIGSQADLFSKAVAAYKAIKKFGIYEPKEIAQNKETIDKNLAKPRPATSVSPAIGANPLTRANAFANGLTEERKAENYRKMVEASKRL